MPGNVKASLSLICIRTWSIGAVSRVKLESLSGGFGTSVLLSLFGLSHLSVSYLAVRPLVFPCSWASLLRPVVRLPCSCT